jgi:hypothetical protein
MDRMDSVSACQRIRNHTEVLIALARVVVIGNGR